MTEIPVNKDPREEKRKISADIRERLAAKGIYAVNLISSPGSGKTTLLEKLLPALSKRYRLAVIEADTATRNDADRLERAGLFVEMVANAITGCHISPAAAEKSFNAIPLDDLDLVVIENVGNLVCPAGVDLGEDHKVVMVSVAEGEDKPQKYPLIFRNATVGLINKIDAAEALDADVDLLERNMRAVNPSLEIFHISARTGEGLEAFTGWIREKMREKRGE